MYEISYILGILYFRIIKYVGLEPILFAINLNVESSCNGLAFLILWYIADIHKSINLSFFQRKI